MFKTSLTIFILFILCFNLKAQFQEEWVSRYVSTSITYPTSGSSKIVKDSQGNIYVSGTTESRYSYLLIKYNSSGNLVWTAYYYGGSGGVATAIALDRNNNLYVTGGVSQKMLTVKFSQTLTGIGQVGSEIPEQFSLSQNYPNPFNPNTVIRYSLSVAGMTNLKIFDVLGKEIATLVNEQMKPGTYEVEFNATNYPSGVYFYSLYLNGELRDSKKMVLIK